MGAPNMTMFRQGKQGRTQPGYLMVLLFCTVIVQLGACAVQPVDQLSNAAQGGSNILNQIHTSHRPAAPTYTGLTESAPDAYWSSFISAGFRTLEPQIEALPDAETVADTAKIQASALHQVEVWNRLIGAEKMAVLERAFDAGNPYLPAPSEWDATGVASGADANGRVVTFLVPPAFGQLISGQQVTVELGEANTPGIMRYASPVGRPGEHR